LTISDHVAADVKQASARNQSSSGTREKRLVTKVAQLAGPRPANQNIWLADLFNQFAGYVFLLFGFRHVGLDGDGRAAGGGDLVERLLRRSVVLGSGSSAGGEPDRYAFAGQSLRDRLAQSRAAPVTRATLPSQAPAIVRPISSERRTASPLERTSFPDGFGV
jgi:hypothetical protein